MKVMFAVPSYTKAPCLEFHMSAMATQNLLISQGIHVEWDENVARLIGEFTTSWRYRGGDPYVAKSRNVLSSEFMRDHTDADCIFMLDDDVGWEPEAVLRALRHPGDIVAGVYPKKQDDLLNEDVFRSDGTKISAGSLFWKEPGLAHPWPVEMLFSADTHQPIVDEHGFYEAALVATGFLRIKRHVMERCQQDSGEYPEEDKVYGILRCWDFFRTGFIPNEENGKVGRWWGEDFFFSFMARQLGFRIWVDPDINFTHSGQKVWSGNFKHALEAKIVEMRKMKEAA